MRNPTLLSLLLMLPLAGCTGAEFAGENNHHYLDPAVTTILLEVAPTHRAQPDPAALELVRNELARITHKDVEVCVHQPFTLNHGAKNGLQLDDYRTQHFHNAGYPYAEPSGCDTVPHHPEPRHLHVLWVQYSHSMKTDDWGTLSDALGEAGAWTVGVYKPLWNESIQAAGIDPTRLEAAVLLHNIGHQLGLVGWGLPDQSHRSTGAETGNDGTDAGVMTPKLETLSGALTHYWRDRQPPTTYSGADEFDVDAYD